MKKISIEMLCPSYFVDKEGEKIDYVRVLIREETENSVRWMLEKGAPSLLDGGITYADAVELVYDKHGRICGTR